MIYGTSSIVHVNDIFQQHMYTQIIPRSLLYKAFSIHCVITSVGYGHIFFASIVKYYGFKYGIFIDTITIAFDRHFCFVYMLSLDITLSMQFT